MYSEFYKEIFAIFVILETDFQGTADIHKLKETVIEKVGYLFKDHHQQYKDAFDRLVREKLISVTDYHPRKVLSKSSEFIHFLKRYKRESGTEFQIICQELFHLYERKDVTDIKLSNIVSVFSDRKAKCEKISCRKFFFPHKYSSKYCPDCYKEMFQKLCPVCIEKNNENPNFILGREKMCAQCKEDKSEELKNVLDLKRRCICRICRNEFEAKTKRSTICEKCSEQHGKDMKLCEKCKKEVVYWSQKLCSYCSSEERGFSIDREHNTATRKCEKCNRIFSIDCSKNGWTKISNCPDCHGYQPKSKKDRPMCKCGERHLKGRQKICKVCKEKSEKLNEPKKSNCLKCNNIFDVHYKSEFCEDCKKLRKSGQKMCKQCKEFSLVYGHQYNHNIFYSKFDDRIYSIIDKLIEKLNGKN